MIHSSESIRRGFYLEDLNLNKLPGEHLFNVMYGNLNGQRDSVPAGHLAQFFKERSGRETEVYVGKFWLSEELNDKTGEKDFLRFITHDPIAGVLRQGKREEELALRSEIALVQRLVRERPDFLIVHPKVIDLHVKARLNGLGIDPAKPYHVKEYLYILQENLKRVGKKK